MANYISQYSGKQIDEAVSRVYEDKGRLLAYTTVEASDYGTWEVEEYSSRRVRMYIRAQFDSIAITTPVGSTGFYQSDIIELPTPENKFTSINYASVVPYGGSNWVQFATVCSLPSPSSGVWTLRFRIISSISHTVTDKPVVIQLVGWNAPSSS